MLNQLNRTVVNGAKTDTNIDQEKAEEAAITSNRPTQCQILEKVHSRVAIIICKNYSFYFLSLLTIVKKKNNFIWSF